MFELFFICEILALNQIMSLAYRELKFDTELSNTVPRAKICVQMARFRGEGVVTYVELPRKRDKKGVSRIANLRHPLRHKKATVGFLWPGICGFLPVQRVKMAAFSRQTKTIGACRPNALAFETAPF